MAVVKELSKYQIDLVGVLEVRWVHKTIMSVVKGVICNKMYIIQRGNWCHIILLNVHARAEDKIDYIQDSSYEEFECVFYKFPTYYVKILL
jgi:hypothetical protein